VALCQYSSAVLAEYDTSELLNCKIVEYVKAILDGKPNFHVNFIMNVSPECDCWNHNDAALVPDIGIAASFDPVALDHACVDLVTKAPALPGNCVTDVRRGEKCEHEDKFKIVHPDTNWRSGLQYAEEIGLGFQNYELIEV
jgi:uncharacterized Fe-S center protein